MAGQALGTINLINILGISTKMEVRSNPFQYISKLLQVVYLYLPDPAT